MKLLSYLISVVNHITCWNYATLILKLLWWHSSEFNALSYLLLFHRSLVLCGINKKIGPLFNYCEMIINYVCLCLCSIRVLKMSLKSNPSLISVESDFMFVLVIGGFFSLISVIFYYCDPTFRSGFYFDMKTDEEHQPRNGIEWMCRSLITCGM